MDEGKVSATRPRFVCLVGQVYEPIDFLPPVGRNPGDKMLISDLVESGASRWEHAFDPWRKIIAAASQFVSENKEAVANLAEHVGGRKVHDVSELAAGEGAIAHLDGKTIGLFPDDQGALRAVSPVCTHLGCVVHFNHFERCWDCPCHGSQFSIDGAVLTGPAKTPLKPMYVMDQKRE